MHRSETFNTIMRQNAMEYDEADELDPDHEGLDFHDFCIMVRERELSFGEISTFELRRRFRALDITGSGRVTKAEYLRFSLRDALARSITRLREIFEVWDDDASGQISMLEFRRAVRGLGYADVKTKDIDHIFREIDEDRSGAVTFNELDRRLRKYAHVSVEQRHDLRRTAGGRRGAALATTVKFDRSSGRPIPELLREALAANAVRVIDLFRDWDEVSAPNALPNFSSSMSPLLP